MKFIITELEKKYRRKKILANISYSFETGKVYGIYGAEKSGKSTLVDVVRGNKKYKYGDLEFEDTDVEFTFEQVGLLHEGRVFPEFMTANEYVKFFYDVHKDAIEKNINVEECFDAVGITKEERHCLIKDLSEEKETMLQLMLFILLPVKVIFVDNPKISEELAVRMKNILEKLSQNSIVIVVSGDEETVDYYAEEKAVLKEGYLVGKSMNYEMDKEAVWRNSNV